MVGFICLKQAVMIKGIKDFASKSLYTTTCREMKERTRGKYSKPHMISFKN